MNRVPFMRTFEPKLVERLAKQRPREVIYCCAATALSRASMVFTTHWKRRFGETPSPVDRLCDHLWNSSCGAAAQPLPADELKEVLSAAYPGDDSPWDDTFDDEDAAGHVISAAFVAIDIVVAYKYGSLSCFYDRILDSVSALIMARAPFDNDVLSADEIERHEAFQQELERQARDLATHWTADKDECSRQLELARLRSISERTTFFIR